jgi:putative inorganic carbon (HCO3(-)) transporter
MDNSIHIKDVGFRQWLKYHFLEKKLNTRFGYFLFSGIALFLGFLIVINWKTGPAILAVTAAFLIFVAVMKNPYFGFYFLLAISSVTITIDRLIRLPLPSGNLIELFTYIGLLSLLLKNRFKKNNNTQFWTNPISIILYFLFSYYIVELFNPEMFSHIGWFSFFRKQTSYFVFYYLSYCLLDSKSMIIYFVRFMIALSTVLALYACKQQWFGYAGFELRWIGSGNGYTLLWQGGLLRKFSVFSDPSTSGILFASVSMLSVILLFRSKEKKEKFWLGLAIIVNLLGYSYSGTRTATLMIIAGILMYCLATIYERRTWTFIFYSLLVFAVMYKMPIHNPVTNRIQSTFEGSRDASAAVRDYNRHQVQPYIQEHPMGGGIFTVGAEGNKYNRGHYLEYLQSDSGYLKTLAEQGPVGLALLLVFYFIIMKYGFHMFFRSRDPVIRTYYIGLLVMMFTLLVAQYSQMAITQYPIVLYFYAVLAIIVRLADFDHYSRPALTKEI